MEQKINSVSSAETKDEVSANVEVSTSSPNNAKPNVGGSLSPTDLDTKNEKPVKAKPHFYAQCFKGLQEIAREFGYNLVIHGSMNRDLDLVAIAWIDEPKPHLELIEAFVDYLGVFKHIEKDIERKKLLYGYSMLAGQRSSYVINLNRGCKFNSYVDEQYYLDISFTPLASCVQ